MWFYQRRLVTNLREQPENWLQSTCHVLSCWMKHLNAGCTNFQQYTIRISYSANQSSCGAIDLLVGKCGQSISWRIFSHISESRGVIPLVVQQLLAISHRTGCYRWQQGERGGRSEGLGKDIGWSHSSLHGLTDRADCGQQCLYALSLRRITVDAASSVP